MASRRILKSAMMYVPALVVAGSIFLSACGTTKKATNHANVPNGKATSTSKNNEGLSQQFIAVLNNNRSKLRDVYASHENQIPAFLKDTSSAKSIGNPNRGYRIQILSTMDITQADSVANAFRDWVGHSMQGYVPKAYVLYKQPYYKIHIGNFQFQEQAMKLNRVLKNKYPGAWVVNDAIDPNLVPADTVHFGMNGQKNHQQY